jgi:two-component system phosphate regulon sensor histidine kinase PhoR
MPIARTSMTSGSLLWTSLGAVGIVVAAGIAGAALQLPQRAQVATLLGSGTLGCLVAAWQLSRRADALRRLEDAATRILESNLQPGAAQARAGDGQIPPRSRLPVEFGPLAGALEGLRERVQRQLKEVAKKSRNLEALIDAMDEPLLATDSSDRVILNSRSAEAILDVPPGGLLGREINALFTQKEVLEIHQAAKGGQTRRDRLRLVTPLGQRTFQVSAAPVPAAWGAGVFGAVLALRDVTELDQAVQVKTDFVANASHELRTPVAAIRSAAETLESAGDDPGMSERLRGMIVSHAVRLEEMLRDLLDLSRLESPDVPLSVEPVDLGELERTLRALSEQACAERGLSLSFEFEDELIGLRTDRKLLTLILRNLVENATKFAYEGTTVRVIGTLLEWERPAGAGGGAATPGVVRFDVSDKGIGIPLPQQERVFERYYQVDPARAGSTGPAWRRGTGLGLAIVKHAVKAMHGRCGLSSVWSQGTTVFVELPVLIDPPEAPAKERAAG